MSDTEKSPLEFKPLGNRGINLTGETPQQTDPLPEADDLADLLEDDEARLSPEMLASSAEEAGVPREQTEDPSDEPVPQIEPKPAPSLKLADAPDIFGPDNTESVDDSYVIDSLGGSLRHAREQQRYAIPDIADHLRIRKSHLTALENENWDELPGTVYIIGYLRSYGSFLGLDPDALISRYKSGDHGPVAANDLSFPSPQKESRMPKWPLIAATLVAGAVGYVFWADWTAEKDPVDTVMKAPGMDEAGVDENGVDENGRALSTTETAQAAPDTATTEVTAAPETGATLVDETVDETVEAVANTAATIADNNTAPAPVAITAIIPQSSGPAVAPANDAAPTTEDITDDATAATEAVVEETATDTADDAVATATTETTSVAATPDAAIPATPSPIIATPTIGVSEANAAPSESGPVGGDSRITLIGRHDAWIQIKDTDGEVLAARLLRKDESYHVPNLIGLKLVTGNAGGLEVAVDGRPGKSLGPIGGVLRDLVLDPDHLKAE